MKKILALFALLFLSACTDDNKALRALSAMHLHDIELTGFRFFGCSEDDTFHTGFKAKDIEDNVVTGVVCSSLFKGGTVRFD